MKKDVTLSDVFIEYYKGIILFGIVSITISIFIYEYNYSLTNDDIMGVISACALFFGTILIGQGMRGWRDGELERNRYFKMTSRKGKVLNIKKRFRK